MLELAILGELEQPTHGYELRRRLSASIGTLRRLSFGSLYPALHRLEAAGLITSVPAAPDPGSDAGTFGAPARSARSPRSGRCAHITYEITPAGRDHLAQALEHVDSDDESFDVAVGLMSKASPAARLRLLLDRRARVIARRERRATAGASRERDPWRAARSQWQSEAVDREVTWLDRLIATSGTAAAPGAPSPTPPSPVDSPRPPGVETALSTHPADASHPSHPTQKTQSTQKTQKESS